MSLWVNIAEKTKQNTCNTLEEKVINTRNLKKKNHILQTFSTVLETLGFSPIQRGGHLMFGGEVMLTLDVYPRERVEVGDSVCRTAAEWAD